MKKRQVVIIGTSILILVIGKLISNVLAEPAEKKAKAKTTSIATVFTDTVKNDSIPIFVITTGALEAMKRLELYSEVQGVMIADNGKFKAGNAFKKGELLVGIRSNDQEAQLYAQRSSFESTITSIMPDLKSDFPNHFELWNSYLKTFTVKQSVADLPKVTDDKLKSFLVGRGIYSSYHSLKNLEIINSKYYITAPYDGVLTAANSDPGTVIRPGQSLGVFIQPYLYELETSTDALTAELLSVGQKVELTIDGLSDKKWIGKINRIVKAIDKSSQMNTFFVEVEGRDLKEGMFLQAKVEAKKIANSFQLSRSALVDNNQVFIVRDGKLELRNIENRFYNQDQAVISGLSDGDIVLTKVPPAAFEGMEVNVYEGK
jgi:multidrug efflux pump subunit AcrA (membrane-fusion protein)